MTANRLIQSINRVLSFDALNNLTCRVRLSDYPDAERKAIETAIDKRRDWLVEVARTI